MESAALAALEIRRCALDKVEQRTRLPVIGERVHLGTVESGEDISRGAWRIVEAEKYHTRLSEYKVESGDDLGFRVLVVVGEIERGIGYGVHLVCGVRAHTSVDLTLWHSLELEVINNSEPVTTTPNGPEEIGVLRSGSSGYCSVGQYDICRNERVPCETILVGQPAIKDNQTESATISTSAMTYKQDRTGAHLPKTTTAGDEASDSDA